MMLGDSESHTADADGTASDRDTLDEIENNSGLICLPRRLLVKEMGAPGGSGQEGRSAGPAEMGGPPSLGGDLAPECLLWTQT